MDFLGKTLVEFGPLVWLLVAIGLGIIEAMTLDLVSIWFAIGAFVAMLPAFLGAPVWAQLATFLGVSLCTLWLTRPVVAKVLRVKKTSTNADRVIGMMGLVTVPIDTVKGEGRVLVNGLEWAARSEDGAPIEAEAEVLVRAIEGVKVIVTRVI